MPPNGQIFLTFDIFYLLQRIEPYASILTTHTERLSEYAPRARTMFFPNVSINIHELSQGKRYHRSIFDHFDFLPCWYSLLFRLLLIFSNQPTSYYKLLKYLKITNMSKVLGTIETSCGSFTQKSSMGSENFIIFGFIALELIRY